jgi:branched-chain amino acid aminotransferase
MHSLNRSDSLPPGLPILWPTIGDDRLPSMRVWLNGKVVPREEAAVSVFDAGFQHGIGLFETMLARNGRVFRAEAHVQRLIASATHLLLSESLRAQPLAKAVQQAVEANALDAARVRLTVTGGNLASLERGERKTVDPTVLIVTQPPTEYPAEFFEGGVRVVIADGRVNPFAPTAGHKTLNYWPRIQALQLAGAKGGAEAMWFSVTNHLAGGSVSNVFLVKGGSLFTPIARGEEERGALPAPVLPGITRAAVIELAEEMNITVHKRMLDINDLLSADEVLLTNSSWGVLPVVGIEREKIGSGEVGPMTRHLRERWLQLTAACGLA